MLAVKRASQLSNILFWIPVHFRKLCSVNSLWSWLLLLAAAKCSGETTNDLISFFPLRSDGTDATHYSPPMELTNAPFINGVLCLNGVYEPLNIGRGYYGSEAERGYRATASVPDLNYESFTISLDFFPLKTEQHPRPLHPVERKLNDWTHGYYRRFFATRWGPPYNFLTGGTWYRWIGFDPGTNGFEITLNNQAFRHPFKAVNLRLGEWHNLMCSLDLRRKQIITILDGRPLETVHLPDDFKFEVAGTEREAGDKELTFVNYSNGKVFNGYAAHLRIFSGALAASEMTDLYSELALERKSLPTMAGTDSRFWWLVMLLLLMGIAVVWRRCRNPKAHKDGSSFTDSPASGTRGQ
jgi:hypothetical protein